MFERFFPSREQIGDEPDVLRLKLEKLRENRKRLEMELGNLGNGGVYGEGAPGDSGEHDRIQATLERVDAEIAECERKLGDQ
ncbi:MAG TPA: hypothetical protein VMT81_02155 [Candidatus Paceibacterota bacterium]|nr:hypothetical protein [Candidatus Paceibacterota bacterium]